jgi:mRNA-degrading endonuclease RelE of RelBE toxin-antitoxin system
MSCNIVLAGPARKALDRLAAKDHKLVLGALKEMVGNPRSGDVLKLEGRPAGFRRRVGNWRIFFELEPERHLVLVTAIERRTTTTYRKR